ncbi:MAG: tetratricopeptide repeat protein [Candidatus Zixiibacteriota bacterium]|nr:MAG: tetratricopeptide repeat protein [candidate division Zixibacteria bacterium]
MAKKKLRKKSRAERGRYSSSTKAGKPEFSVAGLLKQIELNPREVALRLTLAEYYLRHGSEEKILDTLSPVKDDYPFDDTVNSRLYNRLLAFGYANQDKLIEADGICNRGLEEEPNSLDYHFIQCFIALRLREYKAAIEHGQKYLSLAKESSGGDLPALDFSATDSHLSMLHNLVGAAHYEMSQWSEAQAAFEAALQFDPGNYLPYINLAKIARHQRDIKKARAIIAEGLSKCRDIQELRLLDHSLEQSATISVCMIVKNEEKLLPGCLESVRDWVDEIVIVDTGSTDRTVEIAESFGARIFHQLWEGNFSKHRNYSLEQATCDWVFIIDADERFVQEDIAEIRRLINQDEVGIISINVYNVYGTNEELQTFLPSVRFWRRHLDLRYEGIVHNLLELGMEHPVTRSRARIKHLGYDLDKQKMSQKFERTKTLLEKQLEENPDNYFALFNYAQLLKSEGGVFSAKNAPKVLESAKRAIELTDPDDRSQRHIHLMCLDQVASASFYLGDCDTALEYAQRALELKPNYLDSLMVKAYVYAQREDWERAREAYQEYLDVQERYDPSTEKDCLILSHVNNRASAHYGLALIAEIQGDLETARQQLEKTLEERPTYLEANLRLGNIFLKEGDCEKARELFCRQLSLPSGRMDAALGMAIAFERAGELDKSEEFYSKAVELSDGKPEAHLKYGGFLINQGRSDEAAEQFDKAVSLGGDSRSVRQKLADLYFDARQYSKACETYLAILDHHGADAETLNNLGNSYFSLGQFERAEEYYAKALDVEKPLNLTYRNLGLAQARLEKYAEAVSALSQYAANLDQEPEIVKVLAELHAKTGDYPAALSHYEQFLSRCPSDVNALFGLSECYLHMGHRDSATLGYKRVLELDPDFAPAQSRLQSLLEPVGKA